MFEIYEKNSSSNLQSQIEQISSWSSTNCMNTNAKKTKEMRISFLKQPPEVQPGLHINGNEIEVTESFELLGIWLTADHTWNLHV